MKDIDLTKLEIVGLPKDSTLKYEYYLKTWGGFYNDEYVKIHNKREGDFWFSSNEDRDRFIKELKIIETTLNARHLVISTADGFNTRIHTVLHRISRYNDILFYTSDDIGIGFSFDTAKYVLEYKWTPGFNDYPLGEDFDYSDKDFEVINEWITGAFYIDDELY